MVPFLGNFSLAVRLNVNAIYAGNDGSVMSRGGPVNGIAGVTADVCPLGVGGCSINVGARPRRGVFGSRHRSNGVLKRCVRLCAVELDRVHLWGTSPRGEETLRR